MILTPLDLEQFLYFQLIFLFSLTVHRCKSEFLSPLPHDVGLIEAPLIRVEINNECN